MSALTPLDALFEVERGADVPLPPALATLYGRLRLPAYPHRPAVIGNFVTTLDGVTSLNEPGATGAGEISGFNPHDRLVMGLLRAAADAVIVGAGTLRADSRHLWTADHIYPALAVEYQALRAALRKPQPPLTVIVTVHGRLDLSLPVFQSGEAPVLIITGVEGAHRLAAHGLPPAVRIAEVATSGWLSAEATVDAVRQRHPSDLLLVEGGPQLIGDFLAARRLDELFLTLAPQVAGRNGPPERPGLVAGTTFAPEHPLWCTLIGVKRGDDHLFLRYAFAEAG